MIKLFRYLKLKEWLFFLISLVFIVVQVFLDLKLPDYMSRITTLVETAGSRGISDWSELESLTGLKRVYADSELAAELRGLSASAGFELIIE